MAEQTELDRVQKKHEEQLAEQRAQHEHQFQVAMKLQETRVGELRLSFEDRRKELLTQNDGMLGAVGRLYKENESLKARIAELEATVVAQDREAHAQIHDLKRETELKHLAMMNEFSESRTRVMDENKRLQAENDRLREKTKRK